MHTMNPARHRLLHATSRSLGPGVLTIAFAALGASTAAAAPQLPGDDFVACDTILHPADAGTSGDAGKLAAEDFDGDGNVDVALGRATVSLLLFPDQFGTVTAEIPRAANDIAALPGGSLLVASESHGLERWTCSGSDMFSQSVSSTSFAVQCSTPLLVAVGSEPASGPCFVAVYDDEGMITRGTYSKSTGQASSLNTYDTDSDTVVQVQCLDADGDGADDDVAILDDQGLSVFDSAGNLLYSYAGQADGSCIARVDAATDGIAYVRKLALNSNRRLHYVDISGVDPYVALGSDEFLSAVAVDLDGDGHQELCLARGNEGDVIALLNDGSTDHTTARFSNDPSRYSILNEGSGSTTSAGMVAADLECDGDPDLVWAIEEEVEVGERAYLSMLYLHNLDVCAMSMAVSMDELAEFYCLEFGGMELLLTLGGLPEGTTHLRITSLCPAEEDAQLVNQDLVAVDVHAWDPEATALELEFPGFEVGAMPDVRYFVMQGITMESGVVVQAGPGRTFLANSVFADAEAVTCSEPNWRPTCIQNEICCFEAVLFGGCGGGNYGGGTGGVPKPPPVGPPNP